MKTTTAHEVLDALNELRVNPKSYIPRLQERLQYFDGKTYRYPGEVAISTSEGPAAIHECIADLQKQQPVQALKLCDPLSRAASDHAVDLGSKGLTGHKGSDGSSTVQRIERYGDWDETFGENVDFSGNYCGPSIIVNLIIDDGVATRGHRKNCLKPAYVEVGIALYSHTKYGGVCVFDFAGHTDPVQQFNTPVPNQSFTPKPKDGPKQQVITENTRQEHHHHHDAPPPEQNEQHHHHHDAPPPEEHDHHHHHHDQPPEITTKERIIIEPGQQTVTYGEEQRSQFESEYVQEYIVSQRYQSGRQVGPQQFQRPVARFAKELPFWAPEGTVDHRDEVSQRIENGAKITETITTFILQDGSTRNQKKTKTEPMAF